MAEAVVQVGHQQVHTAWVVQVAEAVQVLMEEQVVQKKIVLQMFQQLVMVVQEAHQVVALAVVVLVKMDIPLTQVQLAEA